MESDDGDPENLPTGLKQQQAAGQQQGLHRTTSQQHIKGLSL